MLIEQVRITVENLKILETLTVDGKNVRKTYWTNKEVNFHIPDSTTKGSIPPIIQLFSWLKRE